VAERELQNSHRHNWIEGDARRFGLFAELNAWLSERYRSVSTNTEPPIRTYVVHRHLDAGAGRFASCTC